MSPERKDDKTESPARRERPVIDIKEQPASGPREQEPSPGPVADPWPPRIERAGRPTATLLKTSSRYADLVQLLGTNVVPILSYTPHNVEVDDDASGGVRLEAVYYLDYKAIGEDRLAELLKFMTEKFKTSPEDMASRIVRGGIPLRADEVAVAIPTERLM